MLKSLVDALITQSMRELNMDLDFIIDGAPVAAADGGTFERYDPVTGAIATKAAAASLADVDKVVASATRAFTSWSETGPNARRALHDSPHFLPTQILRRFAPVLYQIRGFHGWVRVMGMEAAELRDCGRLKGIRAFIDGLYAHDLHAKRVASLAAATLGVMTGASLAVAMIGQA
ncbi:MAG TPA: aldehyde dehydrogenase family protein, partial [Acetobacteraceae bacterium]|nr:aldehyde dehydrogenase family protein [Acetobacteraceae bacterium]